MTIFCNQTPDNFGVLIQPTVLYTHMDQNFTNKGRHGEMQYVNQIIERRWDINQEIRGD